jgi:hypothetical protein
MRSMVFRDGKLVPKHNEHAFLARILPAHLRGLMPEQFADEELARIEEERRINGREMWGPEA